MSFFRTIIIFLFLSTISLKANEVTVIELHKQINLDQLVLESENQLIDESVVDKLNEDVSENETLMEIEEKTNESSKENEDQVNLENLSNDETIRVIKSETIFDLQENIIDNHFESINDIKSSLRFFLKKKAKMLLSGCKSKKNPYYNMVEIFRNKIKRVKILKRKITRRQDAPTTFDLNASIYIWKRKTLINFKSFYDSKTVFLKCLQADQWILIINLTLKL